jgi:Tfp pilus assembly protein FimT
MTEMERHFRAGRDARTSAGPVITELMIVLAVILLVGAVALAEVSGLLDAFVHDISFAR